MKTFELRLQDATRTQSVPGVGTFVGEDRSGSFGILSGHARFMTSLIFGVARFREPERDWQYLALPGALLYFADNVLTISTRHYVIDESFDKIRVAITEELVKEETELHSMRTSLRRMEEEALKRIWRLGQERG